MAYHSGYGAPGAWGPGSRASGVRVREGVALGLRAPRDSSARPGLCALRTRPEKVHSPCQAASHFQPRFSFSAIQLVYFNHRVVEAGKTEGLFSMPWFTVVRPGTLVPTSVAGVHCSPRRTSRELDQRWSSWDLNWRLCGMPASQAAA